MRPPLLLCASIVFLVWAATLFHPVQSVKWESDTQENAAFRNEALGLCRIETGEALDPVTYGHVTCARCYSYIPAFAFRNDSRLELCGDQLCRDCALGRGCTLAEPNATEDSDLVSSFGNALYLSKWRQCCNAAWRCCQSMVSAPQVSDAEPHCPRTWDGWTCYEDTQGGSMVEKPCPAHAYYHSVEQPCQRFSKKLCWDNGTWYVHPGFNKEYTIYECGAIHNHKFMVGLSIILHSVSALLLLPAIIIFSFYAQLKIQRILMHKHLCTSLLLYGIASIVIDYVLIWNEFPGPGRFEIVASNPAWCKLLIIGWRYFRLAQYHWMFCEAFYLNRLITTAFAEQKSVLLYYSVGWGFPAVFLATYAVFRAKHGDTKCWIEPLDHYEWIVLFPGLLCLILNFVFLCNIIRILVTKLRTAHTNEPLQFRKAVRAVIILFPLFGTQFLLGVYRKPQLCGAWEVYQYFNRTTDALQGCFVALLFCYLSGEVQTHVARSFDRVKLRYKIARESSLRRSTRTSIRMYAFGNSQDPNVSLQAQDARL